MIVTLIRSTRTVNTDNVLFDELSYHFTDGATGEDLTNKISRADKIANWPSFDPTIDNTRIYNESRGGSGPVPNLNTSTASAFWQQLTTDPLGAPLDALTSTVKQVLGSGGVQTILIIGAVGLLLYVAAKD